MENLLKKIEYSGQSRHSRVHKNVSLKQILNLKKKNEIYIIQISWILCIAYHLHINNILIDMYL